MMRFWIKCYDCCRTLNKAWSQSLFRSRLQYVESNAEECPIPGELRFPARRWVVERTLGWLAKWRSIKIRWCKKPENCLVFLKLASADLLLNLIIE
jgi:hypothetical protein